MHSQSTAARRLSVLLNPGWIVIGYIVTLFCVVVGMGAFPFSQFWLTLLFVVVGAFFVVAVPILVVVYLFLLWNFVKGLMNCARRFCFGTVRMHESQWSSKSSRRQKNLEAQGTKSDLWDRWIDGVR
jgi:hypothetical protein